MKRIPPSERLRKEQEELLKRGLKGDRLPITLPLQAEEVLSR